MLPSKIPEPKETISILVMGSTYSIRPCIGKIRR
jgi:hypothetical protein